MDYQQLADKLLKQSLLLSDEASERAGEPCFHDYFTAQIVLARLALAFGAMKEPAQ